MGRGSASDPSPARDLLLFTNNSLLFLGVRQNDGQQPTALPGRKSRLRGMGQTAALGAALRGECASRGEGRACLKPAAHQCQANTAAASACSARHAATAHASRGPARMPTNGRRFPAWPRYWTRAQPPPCSALATAAAPKLRLADCDGGVCCLSWPMLTRDRGASRHLVLWPALSQPHAPPVGRGRAWNGHAAPLLAPSQALLPKV